ncbi:MAG TPA: roadblock/LC7 domain-containing protein [Thermoplasmata archaeon]|nr:roadblock/LC7 domain-containing protein [Thermoplasmata archaeon]
MADTAAIETILHEMETSEGIQDAILVSRNGTYIAGTVPHGVHVETFAAMFAILLGAAENSTSELKEVLDNVVINLEASKLVIVHCGPKALMVLHMPKAADSSGVKRTIEKYLGRIEDNL